jgi:hypothetical protein
VGLFVAAVDSAKRHYWAYSGGAAADLPAFPMLRLLCFKLVSRYFIEKKKSWGS